MPTADVRDSSRSSGRAILGEREREREREREIKANYKPESEIRKEWVRVTMACGEQM